MVSLCVIFIFLFTDENEPKKLQWLPKEIPDNVYLIVATQTEDESHKSLNKAYASSNPENFIEVIVGRFMTKLLQQKKTI